MSSLDDTIRAVLGADAATYEAPAGLGETAVRHGRRIRRVRAAVTTGTLSVVLALAIAAVAVVNGERETKFAARWSHARYFGARPARLIASVDAFDKARGWTNQPLFGATLPDGQEVYVYVSTSPGQRDKLVDAWGLHGRLRTASRSSLDEPFGSRPGLVTSGPALGGGWWIVAAGRIGTTHLTYSADPASPERAIPSSDGVGAVKLPEEPQYIKARLRGYTVDGRKVFEQKVGHVGEPVPGVTRPTDIRGSLFPPGKG